eukprot:CAMPEP_0115574460 /NCGR_PEP_ID=MMETSP0272-20121206/1536_1 /TAXON_ID=71861 /ORGANISM="Scrippsiella trochoidea, Strain CCMP3099" /LENGTH=154 /DNA_ID=CAMNT_0003009177 /DNA_START=596 /DNA_END=1061 /DNA_ORIENTATION=-
MSGLGKHLPLKPQPQELQTWSSEAQESKHRCPLRLTLQHFCGTKLCGKPPDVVGISPPTCPTVPCLEQTRTLVNDLQDVRTGRGAQACSGVVPDAYPSRDLVAHLVQVLWHPHRRGRLGERPSRRPELLEGAVRLPLNPEAATAFELPKLLGDE